MDNNEILKKCQEVFGFLKLNDKDILFVMKDYLEKCLNDEMISSEEVFNYVLQYYIEKMKIEVQNYDFSCIYSYIDSFNIDINNEQESLKFLGQFIQFLGLLEIAYQDLFKELSLNHGSFHLFLDGVSKKYIGSKDSSLPHDIEMFLISYSKYQKNQNKSDDCSFEELQDDSFNEEDKFIYASKLDVEQDSISLFFKEMGEYPLLTPSEEKELFLKLKETNDKSVKDKILCSNLRMVVSVAKRYQGRGMPLLDLIQEGVFGLSKAIDLFDVSKGYRFSTYAMWWIRQSIARSLPDQAGIFRIPVYKYELMMKQRNMKLELARDLNSDFDYNDLALRLGISYDEVIENELLLDGTKSLNVPLGEDSDNELTDYIIDEDMIPIEDYIINKHMRFIIREMLDNYLSEAQRCVLLNRFGFIDGKCRTLEEVADILYELGITNKRITRERVRQIEVKALRLLRKGKAGVQINEFRDGVKKK